MGTRGQDRTALWRAVILTALCALGTLIAEPTSAARADQRPSACRSIPHAKVIARGTQAIVSLVSTDSTFDIYACHRQTGYTQRVDDEEADDNSSTGLDRVALNGTTLAASLATSSVSSQGESSDEQIVTYRLFHQGENRTYTEACPDDYSPGYAFSGAPPPKNTSPYDGCFTAKLAVSRQGDVSWSEAYALPQSYYPAELSCVGTSFCLLGDYSGGITTSGDPFTGAATWVRRQLSPRLTGVGCASAQLCTGIQNAATDSLSLATITDPSSASPAVTTGSSGADPGAQLIGQASGVLCPSASLCLTSDTGQVLASSDPGAGAASFTPVTDFQRVSDVPFGQTVCADPGLCVAISFGLSVSDPERDGETIAASTTPAVAGSWQSVSGDFASGFGPREIECPSDRFCIGMNFAGYLYTSTDPADGAWTETLLDPAAAYDQLHPTGQADAELDSLSCASPQLCVITDSTGRVFTATDPAGGVDAWSTTQVEAASTARKLFSYGLGATCIADTTTCLLSAGHPGGTDIYSSKNPAAGGWEDVQIPEVVTRLDCPSLAGCVGFDSQSYEIPDAQNNRLTATDDPTGPAGAWRTVFIDGPPCAVALTACETDELRVRYGSYQRLIETTTPGVRNQISDLRLSGSPIRLSWTTSGQRRSLALN